VSATDALAFLTTDAREALVEAVAERAAEIVLHRLREERPPPSDWLYGAKAAAEHLGWPVKRVSNRLREIPHHRNGSRLVFNRRELDEYAGRVAMERIGSVIGLDHFEDRS
jgi:hypothetical protein